MSKLQQGSTNAIILNDDNKFLLTERSLDDDFMPGYWELLGGGMDYGETFQECIKREIREECGIEINIIKPIAANTYFMDDLQRLEVTFLCRAVSPEKIKLSPEHTNFKWIDQENVNSLKTSDYVKRIIEEISEELPH